VPGIAGSTPSKCPAVSFGVERSALGCQPACGAANLRRRTSGSSTPQGMTAGLVLFRLPSAWRRACRSVVYRSCSWFEPPTGITSEPHGSLPAPTQTEGPGGELGSRTAGGMSGLGALPLGRRVPRAGCGPDERAVHDRRNEILRVFCGIDWAEDHVRHEASEVERG
jgi:hypothetical protein